MALDHEMKLDSEMFFDLLPIMIAAALGALMVYLFIQKQRNDYKKHVSQLKPKKVKQFNIYTREDVAKHASRHDAWVVIKHKDSSENRVYDITEYVEEHPGGDSILKNVGGDSTEGFHGPQHPATVFLMAEEYCIGKLAE